METSVRWCRSARVTGTRILVALPVLGAACGLSASPRPSLSEGTRPRAYIGTFERILVAGFLPDHPFGRGGDIDLNAETARVLRMTLRSKASLNVIESQPAHLPPNAFETVSVDAGVFGDVAYWKRVGEEYREPLIVTGTVAFRGEGPQAVEQQVGPRTVSVWRPRFRLDVRLVLISGRTGEILESLALPPVAARATDGRTFPLGLYYELMDRLAPAVLAIFGYSASAIHR